MRLINTILERIANKFGYYKFPRYYIYSRVDKNDKWHRHGFGKPQIYNYYEMLQYTGTMKKVGKECKIKQITRSMPLFSDNCLRFGNNEQALIDYLKEAS